MADVTHELHKSVQAAQVLRLGLAKLTDDPEAIRDTLEGETNLHETIRSTLLSVEEDQLMVDGLTARIDDLNERRARFKDRIEAKRALIEQALQIGGEPKVETDLGTVYLRPVPAKVVVTDEASIPSQFWLPEPPKLNTKAVLAALNSGLEIPGATLSNGGQSMTLRRK